MRHQVADLPDQLEAAWRLGQSVPLPPDLTTPREVLLLGVGGSAAGADVIASLAERHGNVPVRIVRDYTTPPAGPHTLAIATSYSGETEETLAAFHHAQAQGASMLAITTGGTLARVARESQAPVITYRWDSPPRTAFGYALLPALAILQRLGVLPIKPAHITQAIATVRGESHALHPTRLTAHNRAKQLAHAMHGRTPLVLAPQDLAPAANRWVAQFAENAKQWSATGILPEFHHNAFVPLADRASAHAYLYPVLLDSPVTHPRNRTRIHQTAQMLTEAGIPHQRVHIPAQTQVQAILRATQLGDWTSLYLAMLNQVDPWPVAPIDTLKQRLAATSIAA